MPEETAPQQFLRSFWPPLLLLARLFASTTLAAGRLRSSPGRWPLGSGTCPRLPMTFHIMVLSNSSALKSRRSLAAARPPYQTSDSSWPPPLRDEYGRVARLIARPCRHARASSRAAPPRRSAHQTAPTGERR